MPSEEKSAWIYGVLAVASYATYLAIVLPMGTSRPLPEADYEWVMVGTIVGSILASMMLHAVFRVYTGPERGKKDVRDREIGHFGERVGNSFIVIGALAAVVLALLDQDTFWIANAVYLCFVLSAVLSSIARIVAYRRGFQEW